MKPKTAPVFSNFFSSPILAFTSDRTVDFTLDADRPAFNNEQRLFVDRIAGGTVPEPVSLIQKHGDDIIRVDRPGAVFEGDALITDRRNCPLSVRTADCLPVFLWDEVHNCIGLVHAGWKGSRANITGQTIARLRTEFGSGPATIRAALGPCICGHCYEVGPEFKEYFPGQAVEKNGKIHLDLAEVNKKQLLKAGILDRHIVESGLCTKCREAYFSYRRDGRQTGRMISFIMMQSEIGA